MQAAGSVKAGGNLPVNMKKRHKPESLCRFFMPNPSGAVFSNAPVYGVSATGQKAAPCISNCKFLPKKRPLRLQQFFKTPGLPGKKPGWQR